MAPSQQISHKWRNRAIVAGGAVVLTCCALAYAVSRTPASVPAPATATQIAQVVASVAPVATALPTATVGPTATPTITETPTDTPTPTATLPPKTQTALAQSMAATAVAAAKTAVRAASETAAAASPTPTQTPLPTATDDPNRLGLSLPEFISKYDAMTDLQKTDFRATLPGKTVAWSGTVFDVRGDGTIEVNIPGTLVSLVNLQGVPHDQAATVNKNKVIKFTGTVQSIIDFLGLHVYLVDCQIVP